MRPLPDPNQRVSFPAKQAISNRTCRLGHNRVASHVRADITRWLCTQAPTPDYESARKHDKNNRPRGLFTRPSPTPPEAPPTKCIPDQAAASSAPQDEATCSIVSGFKGLENEVVLLAALTDIDPGFEVIHRQSICPALAP